MIRTLRGLLALLLSATWMVTGAAAPATAGGGGCHGTFGDEAATEIKVAENCFLPTVARVDAGESVTWFSGEFEAPHTVTPAAEAFASPSRELGSGERLEVAFDEPGVYPYTCLLHPGMGGAIVVGDGQVADAGAAPPAGAPVGPAGPALPSGGDATVPVAAISVAAGLVLVTAGAGYAIRRSARRDVSRPTVASP